MKVAYTDEALADLEAILIALPSVVRVIRATIADD
jgi:hypothetical protein